jgi:hypothetical protein
MADPILVAESKEQIFLLPQNGKPPRFDRRATGHGENGHCFKLSQRFSARGVCRFFLAGRKKAISRIESTWRKVIRKSWSAPKNLRSMISKAEAWAVVFWDVFGEQGHPVRATVSEMGPLLLGRLLELNDTQEGVLNMVFKIADENGLLLLDLKDLRAMLQYVADNADQFKTQYGNISAASAGAIQRSLSRSSPKAPTSFSANPRSISRI